MSVNLYARWTGADGVEYVTGVDYSSRDDVTVRCTFRVEPDGTLTQTGFEMLERIKPAPLSWPRRLLARLKGWRRS